MDYEDSVDTISTDLRGGPIYIPVTEQYSVREIVARIWEILGPTGLTARPGERKGRTDLTTFLAEFDPTQSYFVDFDDPKDPPKEYGFMTTVGPQVGNYYTLNTCMLKGFFNDAPSSFDDPPMTPEDHLQETLGFERYWRGLCERLDADFAAFGDSLLCYEFWSDQFATGYLNPPDVPDLVREANYSFWLTYLGPRLATEVTENMLANLDRAKWTRLPSGAIFFRGDRAPLIYNDEAYYEMEF
jgi:hypothetical protein